MGLYRPVDFVIVRAPLLPLGAAFPTAGRGPRELTADVTEALAVGSPRFVEALAGAAQTPAIGATLRRYLGRMSSRPTPFGLFAGVALAGWGDATDLALGSGPRPRRTRPDMGWLMALVGETEADVDVLRALRVVANTTASVRAGRIVLPERVSEGEAFPPGVSIRATAVARRALAAARAPIGFGELQECLLDHTRGATAAQVEALLVQLCQQSLLLTELRPPLTIANPARHVVDRLAGVPAAAARRRGLAELAEAAAAWDGRQPGRSFRDLVAQASALAPFDRSPLQVDSGLALSGRTISRAVADEAARAAELLLRLSPSPGGPDHLRAYRRMFEHRYGGQREVPLLELLDPNRGLGPPAFGTRSVPAPEAAARSQALVDLAAGALRSGSRRIELAGPPLERMAGPALPPAHLPRSLELNVVVAAASRAALDAGDFRMVVGPNVGSMAGGRSLGRFADMVPGAVDALRQIAVAETEVEPGRLWAELVYSPRSPRLANVCVRPNVREYEIAVGVSSGLPPERTIPADELLVGVREGALYVRWQARPEELVITAGHMLTSSRAPLVCRFLSEVGRDGTCQLSGFQWGAAGAFPHLPRVESGRTILALERWRLGAAVLGAPDMADPTAFADALGVWREQWGVPERVVLAVGDRGLTLDLTEAEDAGELRRALRRGNRTVVVTELFPGEGQSWLEDGRGERYACELVVPVVRLHRSEPRVRLQARVNAGSPPAAPDLRLPGSDWLYVKLYAGRDVEDDLLAGPVREMVAESLGLGAVGAFFIRYGDPGRHLRLRFSGEPDRLLSGLLPRLCEWAAWLVASGSCLRFAVDTYEREVERFGGPDATSAVERFFQADSRAVLDLLDHVQGRALELAPLAVGAISVEALLAGMGLDRAEQEAWCHRHGSSREESGADYRRFKAELRPLIAEPGGREGRLGTRAAGAIGCVRAASAQLREQLDGLNGAGLLARPVEELLGSLVHLHLNRLLGGDSSTERRVLGLLGRVQRGLLATSEDQMRRA